jgi:hypothetical protein
MKVDRALDQLEDSEAELAEQLRQLAERHAAEHDVYHRGHSLAALSAERTERLRPFTERYGARPPDGEAPASSGIVDAVRRIASDVLGRAEAAGMLLLADLRTTYLIAQRVEIDWAILLQAAKAVRDGELVSVVESGREEAERSAAWLRTRIKESAPQVLATS